MANVIRTAIGPYHSMSEKEFQQLVMEADFQERGKTGLELEEFLALMEEKLKELDVQEEIIEAFRVFDKDKTGFVSIEDMRKVLRRMGDGQLTSEEITEIIRDIDPEGSQAFKYEEYVRLNFDYFTSYGYDA